MEQDSQIRIIENQIRDCYGRVVWAHKAQEKCADILNSKNDSIKLWQMILSALTTSGVFGSIVTDEKLIGFATVIVSVILLIMSSYVKKYDLGALAQKHASSAISLWEIRESYLSLLTDIRAEILLIDEIIKRRDILQSNLHKIYKGSPRTDNNAYKKATESLNNLNEMTLTDEEIDKLLPKSLRKINNA